MSLCGTRQIDLDYWLAQLKPTPEKDLYITNHHLAFYPPLANHSMLALAHTLRVAFCCVIAGVSLIGPNGILVDGILSANPLFAVRRLAF